MGAALEKFKNLIIYGAIVLVLGAAGFFMLNGGATSNVQLSQETSQQISLSQQIEQELLAELLQLREIQLDDSLFRSQTFQSLKDFSRPIVAQPVGRENPFAPIGFVEGVKRRSTSTSAN